MRRLIAALLLCCLAAAAHAQGGDPGLLGQVLAGLAAHPDVRAEFTQQRENPALARPQLSHGALLFVLGHGMLWQVRDPYPESLALTGGQVARIDPQGRLLPVRGGSRGVAQVSQMLQSLLAGRTDETLRQFAVQAEGGPQHWTLRFTPKQARMAQVLAAIVLDGGSYLDGIRIEMAGGESTAIRFADTRDAGALSELERRALGLP